MWVIVIHSNEFLFLVCNTTIIPQSLFNTHLVFKYAPGFLGVLNKLVFCHRIILETFERYNNRYRMRVEEIVHTLLVIQTSEEYKFTQSIVLS